MTLLPLAINMSCAHAGLNSEVESFDSTGDIPSSIPGIEVDNFHQFSADVGTVYRGAEPRSHVNQVAKLGINEVLIFKKPDRNEVSKEIQAWQNLGVSAEKIHHIPMEWKSLDPVVGCQRTLEALAIIRNSLATPDRRLYVHCTAGQDRTGLLMGLTRILKDGWQVDQAFQSEMCDYGYAEGQPGKPGFIVAEVHQGLTPLFLRLNDLKVQGKLSWQNLDPGLCQGITRIPIPDLKSWKCLKSRHNQR